MAFKIMCFLIFITIYFDFTVHEGAFKLLCKNSMLERNNLYCLHLLTSDCSDLKFIPTHVAKKYKKTPSQNIVHCQYQQKYMKSGGTYKLGSFAAIVIVP